MPGKTCNCSPVTAAIPRRSQCGCSRSGKINGATGTVKTEASGSPPLSPTNTTFRVQKSTGPRVGQRQSVDFTAALERMDPSSFNLLPPAAGTPTGAAADQASVAPPSSYIPHMSNGIHQATPFVPPSYGYQSTLPSLNTGMNPSFALSGGVFDMGNGISGQSSVESGTPSSPRLTPTSSPTDSLSQEPSLDGIGSCCSPQKQYRQVQTQAHSPFQPQPQVRSQGPLNIMTYDPQVSTGNGAMITPYPQSVAVNQQVFSPNHIQQPTTYMQQVLYGTPGHPLQYAHWQQTMINYLQSPMHMSYENSPQVQAQVNSDGATANIYTNHDCTCGSGCQCVGCPAHPFNQATREHVRSAVLYQYNSLGDLIDVSNPMPDPPLAASATSGTSPPPAPSPPEKEATNVEEQDRSPGEYFFVQYELGGSSPCLCDCGDNCSCVECLVHNGPPDTTPN
ncbi:hypothetical protein AAE478_007664 [Parahypoxylon ruwenzoriense]